MGVILRTEGLVKRFGGLIATNHVNFELHDREIKGLIGPNGAGKTTFYNLLTGVYKPDEGKVFFQGEDITGLRPQENVRLSTQIGFSKSISPFFNIAHFASVTKQVDHILELLGIESLRNRMAGEISQGDQRLLEVAIALGSNPKALILDEPTAGLSAHETGQLAKKIRDLFDEGIINSVVLVEHDIDVVVGMAHTI